MYQKLWLRFRKSRFFPAFCYVWIGFFSMLSFVPYHLTHFVWIAPFGLYWLANRDRKNKKKLLLHGLLTGIVFYFFSFYWMVHMATVFGGFPLPVAILILALAGVVFSLKFPIFLILFSYFRKKIHSSRILFAGFAGLFAEAFSPQIFPWYWGNLAAGDIFLAQNAEYIGVLGLSWIVCIVSYGIYRFGSAFLLGAKGKLYKTPSQKSGIALILLVLVFFYATGGYLYQKWSHARIKAERNVVMIQPDAPLGFRDGRSFAESMDLLMKRIESLAAKGAKEMDPDLIVLPEGSVPAFSAHKSYATETAASLYWERFESLIYMLSRKYDANVFFNEIDAEIQPVSRNRGRILYYNSGTLYDPSGKRQESYYKQFLLMFGEYMPFEFLYDISPNTARFEHGKKFELIPYYAKTGHKSGENLTWKDTEKTTLEELHSSLSTGDSPKIIGKFLPLICYEVILPDFVRSFHQAGNPDFLVNITEDKWYGKTIESEEHLELARLRSIEYRKWMIRNTNSGVSAYIDHLGNIVDGKLTRLMGPEVYAKKVPVIESNPTFFVRFGHLIAYIGLAIGSLWFGWEFFRKKHL